MKSIANIKTKTKIFHNQKLFQYQIIPILNSIQDQSVQMCEFNLPKYNYFKSFLKSEFQMALTQERAFARYNVVVQGSISYDFHISLESGTHYNGLSELTFSLSEIPSELPVDLKSKDISKVIINGQETPLNYQEGYVLLDVSKLKKGENHVAIQYRNMYDNDGSGCCSFIDVDKKQYLYTQFEPYYANRVFAQFDQPDLKARMRLNIICPKIWKVLSNEYATVEQDFNSEKFLANARTKHGDLLQQFITGKEGKMTLFPDTKLLPTYLYCFVAGEYVELVLESEKRYNNIPMSLYCIESLFKHMQELAPFIFQITIQSMRFFEEFFGYKFAFNKYDQIFAHEYKWGAMQNAGIVTFNDIYIFKEKVSTDKLLRLANTISHELAHHWFGNLVTMKWWDDLWLNESFADFISHFCLEKIKHNCKTIDYESSMSMFLNRKGWGYHEDQMITTHPIRAQVANTSVADSIFDGITYSKGAATMKQLLFLMKEQNFSKALSEYFHKYEWSNATLIDFITQMKKYYNVQEFSLDQWREYWLEKPSLNQIEASWNPEDKSEKAQIKITQTAYTEDHPTLRPHRIKIGLFRADKTIDVIQTLIEPKTDNVAFYNGSNNYQAILLNFEDHTFVKNVIDKVSLAYFEKNLHNVNDILSRTLIWRSFFEMVKDGKMKADRFVDIVIESLANQASDAIFETQFDFIHASINTYSPIKYREELSDRMFNYILGLIPKINEKQKNRLIALRSKLPSFASSSDAKKKLLQWYRGDLDELKGHQMTVGQQWSTIAKVFTLKDLSLEQKEKLFEEQAKKDPSDTAKNYRFICDGLKATKQEFEKIYASLKVKDPAVSITNKNYLANGWNHHCHDEWLLEYKPRYFADILTVANDLEGDHFEVFYNGLAPIDDDLQGQIKEFEKIKLNNPKHDKSQRDIYKMIDNLKRRRRAYQLWQQGKANL